MGHGGHGRAQRPFPIDGPAGILDHDRLKALPRGVQGRIVNAKIGRQPTQEDPREVPLLQVFGKPRRGLAVVFKEGGIGIDLGPKSLLDHFFRMGKVQVRVEGRAPGFLDAMVGPKHLRAVIHVNGVIRRLSLVGRGERRMALRVPILGQDDAGERPAQTVDDGNDPVAIGHGQRAAGAEVILHIDDDQDVIFDRLKNCIHPSGMADGRPPPGYQLLAATR